MPLTDHLPKNQRISLASSTYRESYVWNTNYKNPFDKFIPISDREKDIEDIKNIKVDNKVIEKKDSILKNYAFRKKMTDNIGMDFDMDRFEELEISPTDRHKKSFGSSSGLLGNIKKNQIENNNDNYEDNENYEDNIIEDEQINDGN